MSARSSRTPAPARPAERWPALALAATLLLAAALRVRHLGWGLPDLFEEATPFFRAWDMWHWGPPLSVNLDPGFFRYPSLTLYVHFVAQGLLAIYLRITGAISSFADVPVQFLTDRARFLFVARAVTAIFGVATVAAVFSLGRRAAGTAVGLGAAALVAVNPFHVERSQFIEVDVPLGLLVAWGLAECVRLAGSSDLGAHLRAGAAVGLAASAKYTGALLAAPLLVAHALGPRPTGDSPVRRLAHLGAAAAAAAVAFAATSPFVLLDFDLARSDVSSEQTHMRAGHFGMDDQVAWRDYATELPEHILGWPAALAAGAGLLVVAVVRRRPAAVVLATFVVAYAAVVGSWAMRAERYLLPILPPLVVLAAMLPLEIVRSRRELALAATTLVLGVSSLAAHPAVARARRDPRTAAREWIEARCPPGAFLLMEAWGPDLLEPEDLWKLSPAGRSRVLARGGRPLYAIQYLPTYQTRPELANAYYDLSLYPDADLVVLSSFVGDRFRADPQRFERPLALYRDLDRGWAKTAEFRPEPGSDAPTITIFAQARHVAPFSRRSEAPADSLPSSRLAGLPGTAAFFTRLGLNYETFGFLRTAVACYECGLRASELPAGSLEGLAAGLGRCMLAQGRAAEAADLVDRIAGACSYPAEKQRILGFVHGLRAVAASPPGGSGPGGAGARKEAER